MRRVRRKETSCSEKRNLQGWGWVEQMQACSKCLGSFRHLPSTPGAFTVSLATFDTEGKRKPLRINTVTTLQKQDKEHSSQAFKGAAQTGATSLPEDRGAIWLHPAFLTGHCDLLLQVPPSKKAETCTAEGQAGQLLPSVFQQPSQDSQELTWTLSIKSPLRLWVLRLQHRNHNLTAYPAWAHHTQQHFRSQGSLR